ncbi:metalloregulator ArsR/SmtB family transcription factor [Actinomadura sp. NPDC000600]|uniref:ArsR/SmtB family transcription factor n=1 Tax=Actinomadura sp. NPDC000600 TaxID=3154262 RepID=UPI0033964E45
MGEYQGDLLDSVFSAVSDPTRRAILARLAESDARVTDVAGAFPISLNSTSKHIRVLEGAGLVRRTVRGREHILTLDAAPLAEAAAWIEHYRRFWSERLAALDAFVTGSAATDRADTDRADTDRADTDRADTDRADTDRADTDRDDVEGAS